MHRITRSVVDRHLGCYHVLVVINNSAVNKFLCGHTFSWLLSADFGMELGQMRALCLHFRKNRRKPFSRAGAQSDILQVLVSMVVSILQVRIVKHRKG